MPILSRQTHTYTVTPWNRRRQGKIDLKPKLEQWIPFLFRLAPFLPLLFSRLLGLPAPAGQVLPVFVVSTPGRIPRFLLRSQPSRLFFSCNKAKGPPRSSFSLFLLGSQPTLVSPVNMISRFLRYRFHGWECFLAIEFIPRGLVLGCIECMGNWNFQRERERKRGVDEIFC